MKPNNGVEVNMKCRKCKTENRACASYCMKCRYEFTKEEQDQAKSKSWEGIVVKILEKKGKIMSYLNLSFITGKLWFKIASIILILGIGIVSCFQNGIHLKIIKSDNYQINYNKKLKEYYLAVDNEKTELNLYIPYQGQNITVEHLDLDKKITSNTYKDGANIVLTSNGENDYYLITGKRLDRKKETLKVYIYKKGKMTSEDGK